jgi:hypothetical protein
MSTMILIRLALVLVFLSAAAGFASAGGNVVAYLDERGDLVVIGDELGNSFTICSEAGCSRGAPDDAVWVYSLDATRPTTVNGAPGHVGVWFVPTSTRMRVILGGGADRLTCHPRYLDALVLDAGPGNDSLSLEGQFGELHLRMGDGDDHIGGKGSTSGDFFVDTGDGHDSLALEDSNVALVSGSCRVEMGAGDDRLLVWYYDTIHGPFMADMGAGADFVLVREESRFLDDVLIVTGGDDDVVTLEGVPFSSRLDLRTGRGNDTVSLEDSSFSGRTRFHGGSGLDELSDLGGNAFLGGRPKVIGFEVAPGWNALARSFVR